MKITRLICPQIILINFRKEILPFIPKKWITGSDVETTDDCSDVLVVNDSMAVAAHNEDANVAIFGNTYALITYLCVKYW